MIYFTTSGNVRINGAYFNLTKRVARDFATYDETYQPEFIPEDREEFDLIQDDTVWTLAQIEEILERDVDKGQLLIDASRDELHF